MKINGSEFQGLASMKINESEFQRLASLSSLEFSKNEKEECMKELEEFVKLADNVNGAICGEVKTIKKVSDKVLLFEDLREDEITLSEKAGSVLANGKNDGSFFTVTTDN